MGNSEDSEEFSHREIYGASFESLEALCFHQWPDSIDTVGDIPPGERKSAIFCFTRDNDIRTVDMERGEMVIPLSES